MSARITFNDLVKARSKLEQGPEHKTFKELESEQVPITPKPQPIRTGLPIRDIPVKVPITTKVHKPFGFINKSNFIRFVIPTTLGICVGSMIQQSVGTPVIFVLVFGILGITGAVMSS